MIKPELRRHRERRSAVQSLGRRQQDLFFHPDMPKQTGSKLFIPCSIDVMWVCRGRLKQRIKPAMVFRKIPGERPWHRSSRLSRL
jgi:hypothetical protein